MNRHLTTPEPVVLHYTLNPTVPPPERPSAWDVEIKMEDTTQKSRMATMVQASKESTSTLLKLDEEVRFELASLRLSSFINTSFRPD